MTTPEPQEAGRERDNEACTYILTGFGVLVALLTAVAQQYLKHKAEPGPARARLRARRHRDGTD